MTTEKPDLQTASRRNSPQSIKNFVNGEKNRSILAHSLLTTSLVGGALGIAVGLYYFGANQIAGRWSAPLEESLKSNTASVDSTLKIYLNRYPNIAIERQRIKEQLVLILTKQKQNKTIAMDYYKWLFVVLPITSGAAVVSGISLFYISKEGWENANRYVINIFTTSSTIALLIGSLSIIFKMQDNAGRHIEAFVTYENLYQQILTRLTAISTDPTAKTANTTSSTPAQQLQSLIADTNTLLNTYNKILINFDSSNIQLPSFLLNNSSGTSGSPNESGK
jgi:hypothetical protein